MPVVPSPRILPPPPPNGDPCDVKPSITFTDLPATIPVGQLPYTAKGHVDPPSGRTIVNVIGKINQGLDGSLPDTNDPPGGPATRWEWAIVINESACNPIGESNLLHILGTDSEQCQNSGSQSFTITN